MEKELQDKFMDLMHPHYGKDSLEFTLAVMKDAYDLGQFKLKQQPLSPGSDVEKAAEEYVKTEGFTDELDQDLISNAFTAGASYQNQHMEEVIKEVLRRASDHVKAKVDFNYRDEPFATIDYNSILNTPYKDLI